MWAELLTCPSPRGAVPTVPAFPVVFSFAIGLARVILLSSLLLYSSFALHRDSPVLLCGLVVRVCCLVLLSSSCSTSSPISLLSILFTGYEPRLLQQSSTATCMYVPANSTLRS